jgi:hypothetical protein
VLDKKEAEEIGEKYLVEKTDHRKIQKEIIEDTIR